MRIPLLILITPLSTALLACKSSPESTDDAASSESSSAGTSTDGGTTSEPTGADASTTNGENESEGSSESAPESTSTDESESEGGSTGAEIEPPFAVANEADFGPLEPTGLVLGPPNGTFDTDFDCTADAALGSCTLVTTATAHACVCRADEIVIGDLQIVGTRALVLLAWHSVEVLGTLDVGAEGATPGAGATAVYADAVVGSWGGAGGSFGAPGGNESADPYGAPELVPLQGGMAGQDACGMRVGGGGGGALQISAGTALVVEGTVNAGGGGGEGGSWSDSCNGGAGGGSGGALLLEATNVEIYGVVAANGGGGGSGGTTSYLGNHGSDAASTSQASGGSSQSEEPCFAGDTVWSGSGGAGATAEDPAGNGGWGGSETGCFDSGDVYSGDGGGGGSTGRIRVATATGAQGCICAGDFSPPPSFGSVTP